MKFLNLAVCAAIGLAASMASAQNPIPVAYDAYPPAGGSVTYYVPQPDGNVCAGDVVRLVGLPPVIPPILPPPPPPPPYLMAANDSIDTVNVLFVATAPGTYNVCATYFSNYVFPNNLPCCICSGGSPITIPAGGAFPSVWEISFTLGPTQIGLNDQAVVVGTSSNAFVPAFANQAAAPAGSDVPFNMFLFDINRNCTLEPAAGEAVNFGPGAWNLAMQIGTSPPLQPLSLLSCGNPSMTVKPVPNMTAVRANSVLSTRTDGKR